MKYSIIMKKILFKFKLFIFNLNKNSFDIISILIKFLYLKLKFFKFLKKNVCNLNESHFFFVTPIVAPLLPVVLVCYPLTLRPQ